MLNGGGFDPPTFFGALVRRALPEVHRINLDSHLRLTNALMDSEAQLVAAEQQGWQGVASACVVAAAAAGAQALHAGEGCEWAARIRNSVHPSIGESDRALTLSRHKSCGKLLGGLSSGPEPVVGSN